MAGLFISFEGIEGSGKSTQIALLEGVLRTSGWKVVMTREPGGTSIGQNIRHLALNQSATPLVPATELFLLLADRSQHVHEVVSPALQTNNIVLSDRFIDSTTAYQGYGRGLDLDLLARLHDLTSDGLLPSLTFLLDLPAEEGLQRVRQRYGSQKRLDRVEAEPIQFHKQVRRGYLAIAQTEPMRVYVIDAQRSAKTIHEEILTVVQKRLHKEHSTP